MQLDPPGKTWRYGGEQSGGAHGGRATPKRPPISPSRAEPCGSPYGSQESRVVFHTVVSIPVQRHFRGVRPV